MSVRKHKNDPNKWIIDYYPEGRKGKRCRLTFEGTKAEAIDAEMEMRRMHISTGSRTNPPINRILPEYLGWIKLHYVPGTVRDIASSIKQLKLFFGPLPVSRITKQVVQAFQEHRKGQGVSGRTINKDLSYLSGLIKWMVDHDYATPLPFKFERLKHRRPVPQIPHPADVRKFLNYFKGKKLAMVLLMYLSGLRFAEMANIRWEDINWTSKTIRILGKGGKWRLANLPEPVAELIEPGRKNAGLVFPSPRRGKRAAEIEHPFTSMKTTFKTAREKTGVKINPHLLRHACATYLLESCGDMRLVQTVLGHSTISTTEFYTQVTSTRIQAGLAKSADYISRLEKEKQQEYQ